MIIGIDPGLSGGICILTNGGELCGIAKMPTYKENKKNNIDVKRVHELLTYWGNLFKPVSTIIIEKVHAMPKQGVTSMFNFGYGYGLINAAAQLSKNNEVEHVTPQTWKKHFDLIKEDKKAGILVIEKLYPDHSHLFFSPRGKVLDGLVDAALIARYKYDTK